MYISRYIIYNPLLAGIKYSLLSCKSFASFEHTRTPVSFVWVFRTLPRRLLPAAGWPATSGRRWLFGNGGSYIFLELNWPLFWGGWPSFLWVKSSKIWGPIWVLYRLLVIVDYEAVLLSELEILRKKQKNHENIIGTFVCAFCYEQKNKTCRRSEVKSSLRNLWRWHNHWDFLNRWEGYESMNWVGF